MQPTLLLAMASLCLAACSGNPDDPSPPATPEAVPPAGDASVTLPPIATTPPANDAVVCDGGGPPAAYLLTSGGMLLAFDPTTLATRALGVPSCETGPYARPAGLAVSRDGAGYLVYGDGAVYELALDTLDCSATPLSLQGSASAWIGQVALGAGTGSARLYAYGEALGVARLAVSDIASSVLFQVGTVGPGAWTSVVDLKIDAHGRMFTLSGDGTIAQLDPATGAVLGADRTGFGSTDGQWSLLAVGDQLYFFGAAGGVSRYDVASKTLQPLGLVNEAVVAASAAPCVAAAPAPTEGDAGTEAAASDDGGDEASAPLATADAGNAGNPFQPGDAWIGTYDCAQGLTELALAVDTVSGDAMTGRVDLDWIVGGASGSFDVTGTFDPATREVRFTPGDWVSQPSDEWQTVGLDGYVDDDGAHYAGTITSAACGAFAVDR